MGQLTGRSWTVWCITTAAVIGLLAACAASNGDAGVRMQGPANQAAAGQAACQPQVLFLPTRTTTEGSTAGAINDDGWVAGWTGKPGRVGRAVLWRDNEPPLNLGVRGWPRDINEDGDIAIQRYDGSAAFLWSKGTLRRLRGTRSRPNVFVNGLNDHGVVVGTVYGRETFNARAAIWRNGRPRLLRHPSDGRPFAYSGTDINNSGLVIGIGGRYPGNHLWWWGAGGRGGALSTRGSPRAHAIHVDDRGRIVGFVAPRGRGDQVGPILKWRSVHSDPKKFLNRANEVNAVHPDRGYMVGQRERRAFLAHLGDDRTTLLPDPPATGEGFAVNLSVASGVATGRSPYAPNGGVTVAGAVSYTSDGGGGHRAVLWTCAQSYR